MVQISFRQTGEQNEGYMDNAKTISFLPSAGDYEAKAMMENC